MIRKIALFLLIALLQTSLFAQVLTTPTSNREAGIYTDAILLSLFHEEEDVSIFYTLNGDEPTVADFLYTGPITLDNIPEGASPLSLIPTNPSLVFPFGSYSTVRANSRGWVPPYSPGKKVNVVRYRAFKSGFAPSKTITQTFVVDPSGADLYTMPIISIAMDYSDIFSDESGIYVYGNHPDGNYEQKGALWERIMSIEFFDKNGDLVLAQNARTRMHGGGSRHAPKKTFRIYAETEGKKNFKYNFFDDTELSQFKRILLKAGGHRPDCFPRDDLANMITKGLDVEQQHFKHVIVFVNGEYWGIHSIKERLDKYMIQNLYGIDDDEITLLDQEFDVQNGHAVDSMKMKNLESFIIVNDMAIPSNYKYVTDRIDVDNYIDYMCAEIFLSNEDWVYSNVNIWRRTGELSPEEGPGYDGKFRWALYDLDGAFGGSCANAFFTATTLNKATIEGGTFASYTRFFRGLLENIGFREQFIRRMDDLSNSWFRPEVVQQKMDSIYNLLTPEILENANRWRYPTFSSSLEDRYEEEPSIDRWNDLWDLLHNFAKNRARKVNEQIMDKWGYSDTSNLSIDVNDPSMGRVKVNSILINENLPGVTESLYPWSGYYMNDVQLPLIAKPLPGYRFVEWLETGETNDTVFWDPTDDISYTAIFEEEDDYQPILINEVMLSNKGFDFVDNFNDNDDWLELYNPNNYPVDLSASKLVRDGIEWNIPNGFVIPANEYMVFWHDSETYQGSNHVNFNLKNGIDTVFLVSPTGIEIDQIRYPITPSDNSFGRFPNGSETFSIFSHPTPVGNNDLASLNEDVVILTPLVAYPNPSSSNIQLNKTVSFTLYDLKGAVVMKSSLQNNSFDVSLLKKGIYILLTAEDETLKIVVN